MKNDQDKLHVIYKEQSVFQQEKMPTKQAARKQSSLIF
jgi:hypothetical protein